MKQGKKQKRVLRESLSYTVEVRDKEGRVLRRLSAPSRSYVEQWNQLVNVQTSVAPKNIRDTDGSESSISINEFHFDALAPIGETRWGIRVGKGTTAVAIDDYALETPLEEGVGLDQFSHQVVTVTAPAVAASTCSFTIKRTMINNSGGTISGVRELGCYMKMAAKYGLGFRDVLGTAVDVPDGGAITVEYTIGVTV